MKRRPTSVVGIGLYWNAPWARLGGHGRLKTSSLLPFNDDALESLCIRRQLPLTVGKAVGREDVSDHVGIALHAEAARAADRHLARCKGEEGANRLLAPALHEGFSRKLRTVAIALQQSAVAYCARCKITRLAPRRLLLGIDPLPDRYRLLGGMRRRSREGRADHATRDGNQTGNRILQQHQPPHNGSARRQTLYPRRTCSRPQSIGRPTDRLLPVAHVRPSSRFPFFGRPGLCSIRQ